MGNARLQKFKRQIDTAVLLEKPTDLLYLTGMHLSKGRLLVKKDEAVLFVDGRYFERAKQDAPCMVEKWDVLKKIEEKKLVFDSSYLSYDGFLALKKLCPKTKWIPEANPLKEQRAIKEPKEIETLKRAAQLTLAGINHVALKLREGVTELELALEFEMFVRKNGARRLSFEPIIAFGENSAYPHYRADKTRLKKNQAVLIDAGAVVDDYSGDLTRIVHFQDPDLRTVEFEQTVRIAKEEAISHIKPGIQTGDLDQIVRDVFDREDVKPLYTHSLGHGIGLETHEFPIIRVSGVDSKTVLKEGMVFTIEPGLYQLGVGGVRLEEMVVVTADGSQLLSE